MQTIKIKKNSKGRCSTRESNASSTLSESVPHGITRQNGNYNVFQQKTSTERDENWIRRAVEENTFLEALNIKRFENGG
jgi:hypothetical protein